MNRWLLAGLVLLALVILVSPGIVGKLAEQNIEENIEWAEEEGDAVRVTTEYFKRQWFTSEGRYRVTLNASMDPDADQLPSLVIDTRVDHGIVPITSMSRESGSLAPGLASMVSTLHLDDGSGTLINIPGKVFSEVGLGGDVSSVYLLEEGSWTDDGAEARWAGAEITADLSHGNERIRIDGSVEPWSFTADQESTQIGAMTINADQSASEYGFGVGTANIELESMSTTTTNGMPFGFEMLTMQVDSEIDDARVNANTVLTIDEIAVPAFGNVNLEMDVSVTGVDAESLQKINEELKLARSAPDPQLAMASMYPSIEHDLQRALAAGAELRFDKLDVTLPQGELTTRMFFNVKEHDQDGVFSWPTALMALHATADIRLPAGLVEMARLMHPDAESLIEMGILKQDGDHYQVNAEYAQGLLSVNGAPMPLPMPD